MIQFDWDISDGLKPLTRNFNLLSFIFGCPLYHDNGYLSMANNVKNQVLQPCYCHAETLLLPRWNLATATLEHCYCHAGTLLLTLLLPRWNLATATLQKEQIIYLFSIFQILNCLFLFLDFYLFVFSSSFLFMVCFLFISFLYIVLALLFCILF